MSNREAPIERRHPSRPRHLPVPAPAAGGAGGRAALRRGAAAAGADQRSVLAADVAQSARSRRRSAACRRCSRMDRTTLTANLKPLERRGLVEVTIAGRQAQPPPDPDAGRPRAAGRCPPGMAARAYGGRMPSPRGRPRSAAGRSARVIAARGLGAGSRRASGRILLRFAGLRRAGRRRCLALLKRQRHAVHAVSLPGRLRAVIEDMAEMAAAPAAMDLGAGHKKASVGFGFDRIFERRREARPPGAAVEFGVRRRTMAARTRRNDRSRRRIPCRACSMPARSVPCSRSTRNCGADSLLPPLLLAHRQRQISCRPNVPCRLRRPNRPPAIASLSIGDSPQSDIGSRPRS